MNTFERRLLNERFAYNFNMYLIITLCVGVLFFAVASFAFVYGYKQLGQVMITGFSFCIVGFIGYSFYRIFFVRCPECLGRTRTYADKSERKWIARCKKCSIDWDTGIGAEDTESSS